jgi:membrane fusion protein (multidrug efflux system)
VSGATRPDAIVVPQQAVLQGAQGHFVVIVDKDGKAQIRPVEVGPWDGDNWFITRGLVAGEKVVTDGVMKLAPGAPVKIVEAAAKSASGDTQSAPAAAKR